MMMMMVMNMVFQREFHKALSLTHSLFLPLLPLTVLSGFPPKPLQPETTTQTLSQAGIKNGDQLILKEVGKQEGIVKGVLAGKYIPPSEKRGYFVRRKMPADNSCLFHSIGYVLKNRSRTEGPALRALCAQIVLENPRTYDPAFLGMPTQQYYAWISNPQTWGGGIELRILSDYFQTEIVSFDTCTTREDRFGEDCGYTTRALVIYTGEHYDALALAEHYGAPEMKDQVVFSSSDMNILTKARAYVKEEHDKWKAEQASRK